MFPGICAALPFLENRTFASDKPMISLVSSRVKCSAVSFSPSTHFFNAAAIPTIDAIFSVPALMWFSWLPPLAYGASGVPFRTYRKPIPLGPWNLWAEAESISTPRSFTSILICPTAWTASVWNIAPTEWAMAANAGMSWMEPISLLAAVIETSRVSGAMCSDSVAVFTLPVESTGR